MDRGRGDGQEFEGGAGGLGGGAAAGGQQRSVGVGPAGPVDVNSPQVKEIVDQLVAMGISRPVAEMVGGTYKSVYKSTRQKYKMSNCVSKFIFKTLINL
jgi:hypothetical protein